MRATWLHLTAHLLLIPLLAASTGALAYGTATMGPPLPQAAPATSTVVASAEIVYTRSSLMGEFKIPGIVFVKIPKYIVPDKEYYVEYVFKRSDCLIDAKNVHVNIIARVSTAKGSITTAVGIFKVSFRCGTPETQSGKVLLMIPSTLYRESADKKVLFALTITFDRGTDRVTISATTPATSYLVKAIPKPILHVKELIKGYVDLAKGETRNIELVITSLDAPLMVTKVVVNTPPFIEGRVKMQLPLSIDTNQSAQLPLELEAVKPGAGVLAVDIEYLVGDTHEHLVAFIPVVVAKKEIEALISSYEALARRNHTTATTLTLTTTRTIMLKTTLTNTLTSTITTTCLAVKTITSTVTKTATKTRTETSTVTVTKTINPSPEAIAISALILLTSLAASILIARR